MLRRRKPAAAAPEPASTADELPSPGWQAIDDALARLYGEQVPRHVGYVPPAALSHHLQGCSAYRAQTHWHFVTYGLSELYVPGPDDDPAYSGWGFELTMRVPQGEGAHPPPWPFTMLNELAKHVNTNRVLLQEGDRIDLRAPATGHPHVPDAPPTALTVYAIAADPELGAIDTPNGRVAFLQVVGVTAAEKEQMVQSSTAAVLDRMLESNPSLLTDPARA